MKHLILIVILLFGATSAIAQSEYAEAYTQLFTVNEKPYYVDKNSFEVTRTGNIVFWSLQRAENEVALVFASWEVNCKYRQIRINGFKYASTKGTIRVRKRQPWEGANTLVLYGYLNFACK